MWFREVATAVKAEFDPQGYKIINKDMDLSGCSLSLLSMFIPEIKLIKPMWGKHMLLENRKSIEMLGVEYCDINRSLVEMVYSMMQTGALKDKRLKMFRD